MESLLQNRSVGVQAVTDALSTRQAVRLTYLRNTDSHRIDLVRGEEVIITLATIHPTGTDGGDAIAEAAADFAGEYYDLPVYRRDVDE